MLSIMNIQFGKNKNDINKIKKVYNKGDIITARPQTAKYPYKILSIREFPRPITNIKKNLSNNIFTSNNKFIIRKSSSFVENTKKINQERKGKNNKNYFNHSSLEHNYPYNKNNIVGEERRNKKILRIFSANPKRRNLTSLENEFNEIIRKNKKQLTERNDRNKGNILNKKKVSSFSMSKYIEKYLDKNILNSNKNLYINDNNNLNVNSDLYKINYDDKTQIINFLSQVVNTDNFKKYYKTSNNILAHFHKNKNQISTRNLIMQNHFNQTNGNIISLSYSKSQNNELKPFIINFKEMKNQKVKNKNNLFLKYHKRKENGIKFIGNKSSKIHIKTDSNILNKKSLSIEGDKKVIIIKNIKKENSENDFIDKINDKEKAKIKKEKYKIKYKNKKKFKIKKEVKIKSKKIKIFYNNNINKYSKILKNKMNKYIKNENIKFGNNSDIYDYLISPMDSVEINNEGGKND